MMMKSKKFYLSEIEKLSSEIWKIEKRCDFYGYTKLGELLEEARLELKGLYISGDFKEAENKCTKS